MVETRTYRNLVKTEDLTPFRVTIGETDLFLLANREALSISLTILGA